MSGEGVPDGSRQRKAAAKLLEYWGRQTEGVRIPRPFQRIIHDFQKMPRQMHDLLASDEAVSLAESGVWVVGPPTRKGNPEQWPVVTASAMRAANGHLKAELRLSLISSEQAILTARGWRFDMPELGRETPRPTGHVQPINSWYLSDGPNCIIHPHKKGDGCAARSTHRHGPQSGLLALPIANETFPAFPLASRTLPGLVGAMIWSLYGVSEAKRILELANMRAEPTGIQSDLQRSIGLI